jgi:hypothetical protein
VPGEVVVGPGAVVVVVVPPPPPGRIVVDVVEVEDGGGAVVVVVVGRVGIVTSARASPTPARSVTATPAATATYLG